MENINPVLVDGRRRIAEIQFIYRVKMFLESLPKSGNLEQDYLTREAKRLFKGNTTRKESEE